MDGRAAGVECRNSGRRHDGKLFMGFESEVLQKRSFPGTGLAREEDVSGRAVDELQRGAHAVGKLKGWFHAAKIRELAVKGSRKT